MDFWGDYHASHEANQTAWLHGKRILVIDDEVAVLEGMTQLLTTYGVEVMCATSAQTAFLQLRSKPRIDALIVDHRLSSNETGLQLAIRLKQGVNYPLPYVLVTGDTDPQTIANIQSSATILRFKPLSASDLVVALKEAIESADEKV
jgi:two-component system, sensor histidine kinase